MRCSPVSVRSVGDGARECCSVGWIRGIGGAELADVYDRWCDTNKRRRSLFDVLARLECFPAHVVVDFEFVEDL